MSRENLLEKNVVPFFFFLKKGINTRQSNSNPIFHYSIASLQYYLSTIMKFTSLAFLTVAFCVTGNTKTERK